MPVKATVVNERLTVYKLDDPWPGHWGEFEDILMRIVAILLKKANIQNVRMPPRVRCRDLGKPFVSREKCIEAVLNTRTRLHPWFGLLAYLVASLDNIATFQTQSGETEKWPLWKGKLTTKGVPPSTADLLDWCVLASFEPKYQCLGAIVDLQSDPNTFYIDMMANRNVPVVYTLRLDQPDDLPFRHREADFLTSFRKLICPKGTLQDMRVWLQKRVPPVQYPPPSSLQVHDSAFEPLDNAGPLDSEPDSAPPLDPSSRQRKLESREQFFARMDAEDVELIARESEASKIARLDREREMKKYNSPGFNNIECCFEVCRLSPEVFVRVFVVPSRSPHRCLLRTLSFLRRLNPSLRSSVT